jgi:hypothetical protein
MAIPNLKVGVSHTCKRQMLVLSEKKKLVLGLKNGKINIFTEGYKITNP